MCRVISGRPCVTLWQRVKFTRGFLLLVPHGRGVGGGRVREGSAPITSEHYQARSQWRGELPMREGAGPGSVGERLLGLVQTGLLQTGPLRPRACARARERRRKKGVCFEMRVTLTEISCYIVARVHVFGKRDGQQM